MKGLKKILVYFGIILLLIFLLRGWIFRYAISYTKIGERNNIEITNSKLIKEINLAKQKKHLSINEIIAISNNITKRKLYFSTSKTSSNPNELFEKRAANCIGYASFFNAVANYLIKDQKEEKKYKANHLIGSISFLTINLHQFFDRPFFRDHDFNEIVIIETGEKIFVDPSISDYLGIDRISCQQ
ncbi:MAG TPA: hypothetical protein ENJ53_01935 [Phaeodactylibacter sp.]|nr:hypothetical protein [Phaeodactylibacter sp.]